MRGRVAGQERRRRVHRQPNIAPLRQPRPLFDHDRILAFAVGRPSDGFGDRYRPFDSGRFIARLPGPPYQFIHRVVEIQAEPWVMKAGGSAVAEYDVVPDAWFFAADRQDQMPFAVLLEVALQSCGWLAAYMGSALQSDDDLKFRNLGGSARVLRRVTRKSGTLATHVRVTRISSLAGMIIQQYEFSVHDPEGPGLRGFDRVRLLSSPRAGGASRHPRQDAVSHRNRRAPAT